MSHLKFDYLEPETMIIRSNWDVIVWYRLSHKKSRKEGKKQISESINHQDLVFGKVNRMHRKIGNRWIKCWQPIEL